MGQYFTTALLWFSAIGCGLVAGLYFAFSTFIMTALGRIEPSHGISAMNSINSVILRSLFMPLFFGTTLASAALIVLASLERDEPGSIATIAGAAIYVIGMFVCTIVFNVPLNNGLAAVDRGSSTSKTVWSRYLKRWTFWNHVRTVCSTLAAALYTAALVAR